MLVTLSGADCSGKSTQVAFLASLLERAGRRPVVVWLRPGYSDRLDRARGFVRRLRPGLLPVAGPSPERQRLFARTGVSEAWVAVAVLDMLFEYAVKVRSLLGQGRTVLCDRYVDDALLDLSFRSPRLRIDDGRIGRFIRAVCPRPDVAFLLRVPWELCVSRAVAKNEPFPDDDATRWKRHEAYERLARSGRYRVIDAAAPLSAVQAELVAQIEGCCSASEWQLA